MTKTSLDHAVQSSPTTVSFSAAASSHQAPNVRPPYLAQSSALGDQSVSAAVSKGNNAYKDGNRNTVGKMPCSREKSKSITTTLLKRHPHHLTIRWKPRSQSMVCCQNPRCTTAGHGKDDVFIATRPCPHGLSTKAKVEFGRERAPQTRLLLHTLLVEGLADSIWRLYKSVRI